MKLQARRFTAACAGLKACATYSKPEEVGMRTTFIFVTGLLVGCALATGVAQGNRLSGLNGVNHVGISVERFDEALAFYKEKMGFPEAFVVRDDKGQPVLAYVQVSRNTFVELL